MIKLLPKTKYGKYSTYLFGGFVGFMLLFRLFVYFGERGGDTFFSNMRLTTPVLFAGVCGLGMFGTSVYSIIREKERSPIIFAIALLGLFVAIFISGEIISPH